MLQDVKKRVDSRGRHATKFVFRFFGPNGFKVSFNGSVSFHRLGEKQEVDKAGERDVSRLVNNHGTPQVSRFNQPILGSAKTS